MVVAFSGVKLYRALLAAGSMSSKNDVMDMASDLCWIE